MLLLSNFTRVTHLHIQPVSTHMREGLDWLFRMQGLNDLHLEYEASCEADLGTRVILQSHHLTSLTVNFKG